MDDQVVIESGAVPDMAGESTAWSVAESEAVVEDLLIEEVSIDGMCGVY
jgi:mycofactocin precursor